MGKQKIPNGTVQLYIKMVKDFRVLDAQVQRAVNERNKMASAMMMVATKFQRTVTEEFPKKMYLPDRGDEAILVTYRDDKNHAVEIVTVDIDRVDAPMGRRGK